MWGRLGSKSHLPPAPLASAGAKIPRTTARRQERCPAPAPGWAEEVPIGGLAS